MEVAHHGVEVVLELLVLGRVLEGLQEGVEARGKVVVDEEAADGVVVVRRLGLQLRCILAEEANVGQVEYLSMPVSAIVDGL